MEMESDYILGYILWSYMNLVFSSLVLKCVVVNWFMGKFAQLSSHQAFVFLQNCARWTFSIPGHTRRNARVMPPTCTPQSVPITAPWSHGSPIIFLMRQVTTVPTRCHLQPMQMHSVHGSCSRCRAGCAHRTPRKKIANGLWNIQKLLQPTASWQTKWLISRRFMISSIWIEFGSEDGRCWMLAWENCRSISHHG